ncbi:MAG: FHA domain-containing protein [Deltaproteobacteria bacterium]|nr:FHA domain-containing protein [Deltaproteobacteria bacterium]
MFKLVIQDDEGKTTVVPLIRDEITIGRKEGNTIRLTERNVSRRHARIVRMNGAVAIEDLGSYNGVRVNGTRIAQRTSLTISDRVQIGDYLIELKAEGAEIAGPSDDGKTQPVERIDPAALMRSTPGMQQPQLVGNPNATMVALADTDPNQHAMRQQAMAHAPMAAPQGNARLVILSSTFAGQTFELNKPQLIIGRTDDNDIVINHRSISRNHAKIVREPDTGRFTISDLQSSNGVRVNGEEYGKVELRRDDMVDLGHVRLRFIEAGQDFVFGRDAQAVDMPSGGSKKGLIIALVGLLAVGGIVVAVTAGGGSKGAGAGTGDVAAGTASGGSAGSSAGSNPGVAAGTNATGSGSGDGTGTAAVATPPDAPEAAIVADAPSGAMVGTGAAGKLDECNALVGKEDWAGLAGCATDLAALDPSNAQAKALTDQAKKEMANSLKFNDLRTFASKRDYAQVVQQYDKIDPDSIYKDRARDLHDKLHTQYVNDNLVRAKQLAAQHKCKDVAKLGEQAGKIWPDAKDAINGVACSEAVAVNPPGGGGGSGKPPGGGGDVTPPGGGGGSAKPPGGGGDSGGNPAALLDEAKAAAKNSQWGKALRLCEEAMRSSKGNQEAVMVCALASCNLKNTAKAKLYIGQLGSARAQMARQSCLRNGVEVE